METYVVGGEEIKEEELREISKRDIFNLEPLQVRLEKDFRDFKMGIIEPNKTLVVLNKAIGYRCVRDNYASISIFLSKLKRFVTLKRFKENLGKEINLQPTYEEYCDLIFSVIVFENPNPVLKTLHRTSKHYVINTLNSNVIKNSKLRELIIKAYSVEFGEAPLLGDIEDVKALMWEEYKKCRKHDETHMLRLYKVVRIIESYLELLNLKMANKAGEEFYNSLKENWDVFETYYIDLKLVESSLNTEGKEVMKLAKENFTMQTGKSVKVLDSGMIDWLDKQEIIKDGEGKNVLFLTLLGSGTQVIGDIKVTCIAPSMYDTLEKNNVYDFSKYDKIIRHTVGTKVITK